MARGTQHRKRRTGPNARQQPTAAVAAPRKQKPPQWQEQLFFQRLRVHAKLVFVFLALVFALSFVFLGVGSGSTGITEALQNAFNFGKGSSGASVSKLQSKTQKNPADAQAWRDLATAYETKHQTHDAITALEQYTGLRPKDTGALAELASQYSQQAQQYASDYQAAQLTVQLSTPASATFPLSSNSPLGKAFNDPNALKDPIATAVQSVNSTAQTTAYQNYQSAQRNAEQAYVKITKLTPTDANAQLQLGQTAQSAGDSATALAAYKKFLKLSPKDPLTPQVKQQIKTLAAQAAAAPATSASK